MGLLDGVLGQLGGNSGGGNQILNLIMGLISDQGRGGLAGLLGQLRSAGLGDAADSWVSTGRNLPVSADQISTALGSGQLRELAQQFGISPDALPGQLANILPQVVDKLTPQGRVPDQLPGMDGIGGLLKGLFD
jgi:uncharacterized protein YidB (DUF937 family)